MSRSPTSTEESRPGSALAIGPLVEWGPRCCSWNRLLPASALVAARGTLTAGPEGLRLRSGGRRRGHWTSGGSCARRNAIAGRRCHHDACQSEAGLRFIEPLDLAIFLHRDAQVPVAFGFVHVHEAGNADPTPDPCGRRLVLQPGKPIGPDRDLDDIAAPRAKIDEDIPLVRTFALFPGSRLDFDDPPDQLDPVADPFQ